MEGKKKKVKVSVRNRKRERERESKQSHVTDLHLVADISTSVTNDNINVSMRF